MAGGGGWLRTKNLIPGSKAAMDNRNLNINSENGTISSCLLCRKMSLIHTYKLKSREAYIWWRVVAILQAAGLRRDWGPGERRHRLRQHGGEAGQPPRHQHHVSCSQEVSSITYGSMPSHRQASSLLCSIFSRFILKNSNTKQPAARKIRTYSFDELDPA
jgi:hypothetical protein